MALSLWLNPRSSPLTPLLHFTRFMAAYKHRKIIRKLASAQFLTPASLSPACLGIFICVSTWTWMCITIIFKLFRVFCSVCCRMRQSAFFQPFFGLIISTERNWKWAEKQRLELIRKGINKLYTKSCLKGHKTYIRPGPVSDGASSVWFWFWRWFLLFAFHCLDMT